MRNRKTRIKWYNVYTWGGIMLLAILFFVYILVPLFNRFWQFLFTGF